MTNRTCETCAHGDKPSEDEPCNRCAIVDGMGSRFPVRWAPKAAPLRCMARENGERGCVKACGLDTCKGQP